LYIAQKAVFPETGPDGADDLSDACTDAVFGGSEHATMKMMAIRRTATLERLRGMKYLPDEFANILCLRQPRSSKTIPGLTRAGAFVARYQLSPRSQNKRLQGAAKPF
jgi:hypothetical protein